MELGISREEGNVVYRDYMGLYRGYRDYMAIT